MADHLRQIERLLRDKTWQRDCLAIQVETLKWIVWQEHREQERTGQVFAMFAVAGWADRVRGGVAGDTDNLTGGNMADKELSEVLWDILVAPWQAERERLEAERVVEAEQFTQAEREEHNQWLDELYAAEQIEREARERDERVNDR